MVKVESLVQEFLGAQSLKVLPQGPFGDAVNQFVSKDDKHAMELFVSEHLTGQVKQMLGLESDDEDLNSAMDIYRTRIEQQLPSGTGKASIERKRVLKPKPSTWDSDFDGNWEDEPDAWEYDGVVSPTTTQAGGRSSRGRTQDDEMVDMDDDPPPTKSTRKTTTRAKAPAKKAPAKKPAARGGRGRKAPVSEDEEEEEEEDVVMESDDEPAPPPKSRRPQAAKATAPAKKAAAGTRASGRTKQTTIDFSQKPKTQGKAVEISDDEISDEDDAFEPAPVASRTRRR